jgi:signal transduction histidine kinase
MRSFLLSNVLFFFLLLCNAPYGIAQSWETVNRKHSGKLTIYWYESRPFVYQTREGMAGIEFEVLQKFKTYLRQKYKADVTLEWKKSESFGRLCEIIRDGKNPNVLGASAFSITDDRRQTMSFSPAYMSDITVLLTSGNIPIADNLHAFYRSLPSLKAITIEQTTYEQELFRLKNASGIDFPIRYIHSSENILRTLARTDSAFGFIDLPVYMMLFNEDPSLKVNRQNILTIKREGYGITYPQNSDWGIPLTEYFNDPKFKSDLEKIIARHIDMDLYRFVEELAVQSDGQEVQLLTKEKEIQSKDLLTKSQQILTERQMNNFLVALCVLTFISLVVIFVFYKKSNQQKEKIETQRKNIEEKSEQLEKRNQHLLSLDEEKNNLIKILAHDLRTPINHVQGLAQVFLLSYRDASEDQRQIITQIQDASVRLNKMISHTLDIDALENNRVSVFMDDLHISSLVHQVVASFEKAAQKKEISISFTSQCESCVIKGDSLFLIQVFENLVSNALKFSPPGKTIKVIVQDKNGKALVRVRDQGPGLTDEDKQNLFKKFSRLSAKPTSGEPSLGLGLSIVKKYVELMEGKVWCESEVGNGAEFIVEFPKITNLKR